MLKHLLFFFLVLGFPSIYGQVASNVVVKAPTKLDNDESLNSISYFEYKRKRKSKQTTLFQIQGGLVYDMHRLSPFLKNNLKDRYWDTPIWETPFFGFSQLSLSLSQQNSNRIRGLELSGALINVDAKLDNSAVTGDIHQFNADWQRNKKVLDLMAFYLLPVRTGEKIQIYGGPDLGLGYSLDEMLYSNPSLFPPFVRSFRLGIGARLQLQFNLSDKLFIQFVPRLTLLDLRYSKLAIGNVKLSYSGQTLKESLEADFIRGEFYLPIGIGFRW